MERGKDHVHAAREAYAISALFVAEEWGAYELVGIPRGRQCENDTTAIKAKI